MPGECFSFDAYQSQTSRKGVVFLTIAHIRGVVCNEFKIYCGQYLYRMCRRRHISAALTDDRLGGDHRQHSIKQDNSTGHPSGWPLFYLHVFLRLLKAAITLLEKFWRGSLSSTALSSCS